MAMTAEKFDNFKKQKQVEIDSLGDKISLILMEVGREAQKIFDEGGVEAFGDVYCPEYYGVTSMSIPGQYDSVGLYFHPEGNSEKYSGWISSSETC